MKQIITSQDVATIPISAVRPSQENPRGIVQQDASFQRLAASIAEVGILVPLVVRELKTTANGIKYELVDGERRFRAAKAVRRELAPAHIVKPDVDDQDLRQFMFHLHMTREQWSPLAQVKSLSEMYPQTDNGIPISQKVEWTDKIAEETSMDPRTADDRVALLCWPKELREQIYEFDEAHRAENKEIYSYVLATEKSVVEPAYKAFKDTMGSENQVEDKLNKYRKSLLNKLIEGVNSGSIHNRDQIRDIKPLFDRRTEGGERREARKIFDDLVTKTSYGFDDAKVDLELKLPQLVAEKPVTPRRVIAMMRNLAGILSGYKTEFIDAAATRTATRKKLHAEFAAELNSLLTAARSLKGKL
jgi:ParB/RepB/Spo0J family partition protein